MSEILSKYSKTQNLETKIIGDSRTPYSFTEWLERNIGLIPNKERKQYEQYLLNWYSTRSNIDILTANQVKQYYIDLLKQITLTFKTEAEEIWNTDIDFDNPLEVEQVIPFYAKKLKDVAIYLINKREAIKKAKLKYNTIGSNQSLERLFYEYLLKAFTKNKSPGNEYTTTVTDLSVFTTLPELSSVSPQFQIEVEELYDNESYFDHDPSVPVSAYFSFTSDVTSYLDSLNISTDQYEWLYNTGVSQLCADNPLLWSIDNILNQYKDGIPLSALESTGSEILNDYNRISLAKKYFGEKQYIVSGGFYIPWSTELSFDLQNGNNWFYWPSGNVETENNTNFIINPLYLTGSNLIENGATAGETYSNSDVIFIQRENDITGAWLQEKTKYNVQKIMSMNITKGHNPIVYPFPGKGLSGEGLEWTGREFSNADLTYYYLDKVYQDEINKSYWSTRTNPISTLQAKSIHNTNLISNGSRSSIDYEQADKITYKSSVSSIDQNYAWLYKFDKTDIPIQVGTNNIYWPFERYNEKIETIAKSNQCINIPLSTLDVNSYFVGAVANNSIDSADKLYKMDSIKNGNIVNAAWLKGRSLSTPNVTQGQLISGTHQPGLAFKINAGDYVTFYWEESRTLANNVFKGYTHQKDCSYLTKTQFSLYQNRPESNQKLDYNQWSSCSCKSIYYTPFGHPGNNFDDYDRMTDFIVSISDPISAFNLESWKDNYGRDYTSSDQFGWFKVSDNVEPDVGWGTGNWVTNNGNLFTLSANRLYMYYRSNMLRDINNAPYFIKRYQYNNSFTPIWTKMYFDTQSNIWVDAGIPTDIILNPGDYLTYDHVTNYMISLTTNRISFTQELSYNDPNFNNSTATTKLSVGGLGTKIFEISSPYAITTPVVIPCADFSSIMTVSGTFINNDEWKINSTIVTLSNYEIHKIEYTIPSVNFMVNVPLTNSRPYWAKGVDIRGNETKQKGINIWGGAPILVDDYNFKTQPAFSDIILELDSYFDYIRGDASNFTWNEEQDFIIQIDDKKWCKLLFGNETNNLSDIMNNNLNSLVVTATDELADLMFNVVINKPLLVNYYAISSFTWKQEVENSSLGIPPTGGVWVPIISSGLIEPLTPYAHLTNRHFPTYASAPFIGQLYSTRDSGGFFIPKTLGISTALAKNLETSFNTANNSRIYRNPTIYASDYGLTTTDQIVPLSVIQIDPTWMKSNITEEYKAGQIEGADEHQEFIPYQTKDETSKSNINGVIRESDPIDPWNGTYDNVWENSTDWPTNWRNQENIKNWYDNYNPLMKETLSAISVSANVRFTLPWLFKWRTDIFGMQYALYKQNSNTVEEV